MTNISFEPISVASAPLAWRELLSVTRSEVMRPANVGLQAVARALHSSDRRFDRVPLLVPFRGDGRYLAMNPDLRQIKRSTAELGLLSTGIASLILTQGVTYMFDHLYTPHVARDEGNGSLSKRMSVLDQEDTRDTCARIIGEELGRVVDFTVRWQPGANGGLSSVVEVAAKIEGGNVDSKSVVLDSSSDGPTLTILAKQGSTIKGVRSLQDALPEDISKMGQSLMVATSLT